MLYVFDGKAFHSFTKGLEKPFDYNFMEAMQKTMLYLCKNIQGCVFGYTQSDEITLILCDYQTLETDAWFKYNVQKMVSIAASMATFAFASNYTEIINKKYENALTTVENWSLVLNKLAKGAFFDARAFNLTKEEVVNYFIWRQQDATRNSIQAMAQSLYSQKEIQGLSCNALQNKMLIEKNVNWSNLCVGLKRGVAVSKSNGVWITDLSTPIFSKNRDYIEKKIIFE